jgi:ubiquinone/menaquinone biosynthesis C-methylase UbiE
MSTIQADFDRIAALSTAEQWDHNSHYHPFLLKHLPSRLQNVLDIGCGTGTFSRQLARRSEAVTGLDLSPEMIRVAESRSQEYTNIRYQVTDVMNYPLQDNHFDCIASIATLHHLPFEEILLKIKGALKPNGTLLVLDLFEGKRTPLDFAYNALAFPVSRTLKLLKVGRVEDAPEARAAWEAHSEHDRFLTLAQIREICQKVLPGAKVKRHLLWRYSLVWRKK